MPAKTELELDLAKLVVKVANLSQIDPHTIDPQASLFRGGLGLDSIDILELIVNLESKYGVKIRNDEEGKIALQNIHSLARFTEQHAARPH